MKPKLAFNIVALCALLIMSLGACAPQPAPAATAAPATSAPAAATVAPTAEPKVSLDLIGYALWSGIKGNEANGQGQDYWNYIASEFMKLHPNVTVNVEMWDWDTGKQKFTTRIAAHNPPDVEYTCDQDYHIYADYYLPMDKYIDDAYKADVTPATWALYTEKGQILGLPAMVQWNALIINADLFRERGVPIPADPDRAWTWDEFMNAVQKLTFTRSDGTKVYGTAVAAINWDMEWYNLHYLFNRGARFMDPTLKTFTLNNDKGVEAMQWLLDLQDKYHVIPPGVAGLKLDDAYQMLYRGQVAMFHGAPWVISAMQSQVAGGTLEKAADLMIVQYPHFPGDHMVTDLASCGFAVGRHDDDPYREEMAAQLALFITNTDHLRDWKAGGYIPARASSMKDLYAGDGNMTALINMEQYGEMYWARVPDMWLYADQLNAILPAVFNHQLTPKQALDRFVNETQPIFDKGLADLALTPTP